MCPASSPGSTASLRPANQQRVVALLRHASQGDLTQAEISRLTGLAGATVSNIVRDLSAAGLLETEPGSGRRGTVVRLSRAAGLVAAIDFGHTHVAVAIADLTGRILAEAWAAASPDDAYTVGLERASVLLDRVAGEASATRE